MRKCNVINVIMWLFVVIMFSVTGCGSERRSTSVGSSTDTTTTTTTPTVTSTVSKITVSGTASEGALITGKTVMLKDATGKSATNATTDSTGTYSIDVTGLTPPFLVTVTGTNGTYVSHAPANGTANINPITTMVVTLAAGTSDTSSLFTNLTPAQLSTITSGYAAKADLVATSLQKALPTGVSISDYFTGAVKAGTGMDAVFDTYKITIDPTAGVTVKTKDSSAATVLTVPVATVKANTTQALPTINIASSSNSTSSTSTSATPPTITNLKVNSGFSSILLSWDGVNWQTTGTIEIWRSKTSEISAASKVGSVDIGYSIYSDTPTPSSKLSQTFYYWVKVVSSSNASGAFNSTQGTSGHTADDPEYLICIEWAKISGSDSSACK